MTHPLIIRPEAEQDMADGRDWYEGQREGLGAKFLTAVDDFRSHPCKTPELYGRPSTKPFEEPGFAGSRTSFTTALSMGRSK